MDERCTFQIDDPEHHICELGMGQVEALQELFERCEDYTRIVEGERVSLTAARELFQSAPPGRSTDDKFIYGILDRQDRLVGVLEGMRHYPEKDVWWIGLLMFAPEARGHGLGKTLMQSFEKHVVSKNGTTLMLGVVEENDSAYRFWQGLGFDRVRQTEPRTFGKKIQTVSVMRKALIRQADSPGKEIS